jgi:hypothetical protein
MFRKNIELIYTAIASEEDVIHKGTITREKG